MKLAGETVNLACKVDNMAFIIGSIQTCQINYTQNRFQNFLIWNKFIFMVYFFKSLLNFR